MPPLHARRWVIPFNRTGSICHAPGTAHRPFPTVSLVGSTVQPHKLYMQRGGRQIAAPTVMYHVFIILKTQIRDKYVYYGVNRHKLIVGAAISRPPRFDYNLCGLMESHIDMSFRGSVSESRNLPELHVLFCAGSFSNVVDSSTPLTLRSE